MINVHNKYIRTLKKARLKSDCKIKLSALAESGGRIIAVAYNTTGSMRRGGYEYSRHAEANLALAIWKIYRGAADTDVYIFRELAGKPKKNKLLPSRPCRRCWSALAAVKVKRVFYTVEDGWEMMRIS